MADDVLIRRARFTAATGGGNQDLDTAALGGRTPKACLFLANRATSVLGAADHYVLTAGACTATDEFAPCGTSADNQANSTGSVELTTARCLSLLREGLGTIRDASAHWVNFHADGVRINWDDAPPWAFLFDVVFFAGDDLDAKALVYTPHNSDMGTVSISTSFTPGLIFTAGCERDSGGQTTAWGGMGLGLCAYDGSSITQQAVCQVEVSGKSSSDPELWIPDGGLAQYGYAWARSGLKFFRIEYENFSIGGCDAKTHVDLVRAGDVGALIIGLGDRKVKVAALDTPTVAGNQAYTGFGFHPGFLIGLHSKATAIDDAIVSDAKAEWLGVGTAHAAGGGGQIGCSMQDAQATMNTKSWSSRRFHVLRDGDGTLVSRALVQSFDPDGFTLFFDTAPGTARKMLVAAVEEPLAARAKNSWISPPWPPGRGSMRMRGLKT